MPDPAINRRRATDEFITKTSGVRAGVRKNAHNPKKPARDGRPGKAGNRDVQH
jgi:hypothetical protein